VLPHWLLATLVVAFLAIRCGLWGGEGEGGAAGGRVASRLPRTGARLALPLSPVVTLLTRRNAHPRPRALPATSNAELLVSVITLTAARREMVQLAADIKAAAEAAGGGRPRDGGAEAAGGDAAPPALSSRRLLTTEAAAGLAGGGGGAATAEPATLASMRRRLRQLHHRSARIEAAALLFPALHLPSHEDIARAVGADVEAIFGPGAAPDLAGPRLPKGASSASGGGLAGAGGSDAKLAFEKDSDAGAEPPGGGGAPVAGPPAPAGRFGGLKRWAALQPKFEWLLVLKIVVLHLVTGRVGRWAGLADWFRRSAGVAGLTGCRGRQGQLPPWQALC
jgi:hypothetical protein